MAEISNYINKFNVIVSETGINVITDSKGKEDPTYMIGYRLNGVNQFLMCSLRIFPLQPRN